VFVRGHRDRFQLSLDSSGEHLHFRGLKTHGGRAPLRETLAAAALLLAGYDGTVPLVDPMCGSGTFSFEGALIARSIAPGLQRDFSFTSWPSFREKRWAHLLAEARGRARERPEAPIQASDHDGEACTRLDGALRAAGLEKTVRVRREDFFRLEPHPPPGVVALNPPYGRRLGRVPERGELLAEIVDRLRSAWRGWTAVLVLPTGALPGNRLPTLQRHPTVHGGLKVEVWVLGVA
jgi:putative N6-adenine-specific DNA methylase